MQYKYGRFTSPEQEIMFKENAQLVKNAIQDAEKSLNALKSIGKNGHIYYKIASLYFNKIIFNAYADTDNNYRKEYEIDIIVTRLGLDIKNRKHRAKVSSYLHASRSFWLDKTKNPLAKLLIKYFLNNKPVKPKEPNFGNELMKNWHE